MIRPGDIAILLAGVALIAGLGWNVAGGDAARVRITHAGHEHRDYPLDRAQQLRIDGPLGATVIEIRDGRVRVAASPCSGKLCLRAGWLESAGEATACVPNRVSLVLLGADARFDAVSF